VEIAAADNRCEEARYITNYHRELNKRWRAGLGELGVDRAWEECLDDTGLQRYAQSMKSLGERWLKQSQSKTPSRVEWCIEMVALFYSDVGLKKVLEKYQRKSFFLAQGRKMNAEEEAAAQRHASTRRDRLLITRSECDKCCNPRLNVLDVGSCYDPFFRHCRDKWNITALDLCPAEERVFQCDFVRLTVTQRISRCIEADSTQQSIGNSTSQSLCSGCFITSVDGAGGVAAAEGCGGVTSTDTDTVNLAVGQSLSELSADSQHVVIFCLLLSFMPSAQHRWRCCLNAWLLLKDDGLLLIISPMSIQWKPHRDSTALKQWKESIEAIGFVRWQQTRVERNHCMAFRKVDAAEGAHGKEGALYMPCDDCDGEGDRR
jgi:hypothetical protein